jgi:hypothetical protein
MVKLGVCCILVVIAFFAGVITQDELITRLGPCHSMGFHSVVSASCKQ